MRLVTLWAIWIFLYLWSDRAGDWTTPYFNAYAASISLVLIIASCPLRQWWAHSFRALCLIRIGFEASDAFYYFPDYWYDAAVATLNGLEFVVIFFWGGIMTLRGWYVQSSGMLGDIYRRLISRL